MALFLVQGDSRAGKTHQMLLAAAASGLCVSGFVTLRSGVKGEITFSLVSAAEIVEAVRRAGGTLLSPESAGEGLLKTPFMTVSPAGSHFDREVFGHCALELLKRPSDLMLFDEIGGAELFDDAFYRLFIEYLSGGGLGVMSFKSERNAGRMLARLGLGDAEAKRFFARRRELMALSSGSVAVEEIGREQTVQSILGFLSRNAVRSHV